MIKLLVKKRASVFTFAILVVVMGIIAYISLPREFTPEIKQPYIFVSTVYPGVAAKDMENLVTRPIEEEIDGEDGLDELTSSSSQSVSFIMATFTSDVDQEAALRRVRNAVDNAKPGLPDDAEEPFVEALSSSSWPILTVVLSHPGGVLKINEAAEQVKEKLKHINGVKDVDISGKREKEMLIELRPDKLKYYGFTINDVINAVSGENTSIPGGTLKSSTRNYTLSVTGEIKNPEEFRDITVSANGVSAKLRELGKADFTWKEPESYSRINGEPCISLYVTKKPGKNIIDVCDEARVKVEELMPELPEGTDVSFPSDESELVRSLLSDLENNIITAFILVMGVTLFFLGKRNALFVALAVPFSMLMSFYILQVFGITLNMVVLFSLVLALGMLVDNGIVIVENIFRHAGMGKSKREAAIDGSMEVGLPVFASTLTTCLAFFPVIFMPGVMGDFMGYLPKTVIIVLACSLIVALTINPVFCATFLKMTEESRRKMTEGGGTFQKFQAWYEKMLIKATHHSILTVMAVVGLLITGMVMLVLFGKEPVFFPGMDPNTGVVKLTMPQGTPVDTTDKYVRLAEEYVGKVPASIESYLAASGRESGGDRLSSGEAEHKGSIRLNFMDFRDRKVNSVFTMDTLRKTLEKLTGPETKVVEQEMGPPTGAPVSYQITGEDYAVLGAYSDTIVSYLKRYGELKEIESNFEEAKPEIEVEIDRRKAKLYGLSTAQVASKIRNAINGGIIGKFRPGGTSTDEYDIVVRYPEGKRNSFRDLAGLEIINRDDDRIPLNSIAGLSKRSSVGIIRRRNLERSVEVSADFKDKIQNKNDIKQEIDSLVYGIRLPEGYSAGKGSGLEMRKEAQDFLAKAFVIAVFLIMIVLIAQFDSIVQPFIIIFSVLLALGGVFWGYVITGMDFSIITSGIGCIALAGVVVNNCIVLIDYTNLLIKNGTKWYAAIIEAGKTRLRPVLLTAITTILGLLPMALEVSFNFRKFRFQLGSDAGQMWVSFSWTVIFGLAFATVMTLIIVPCMLTLSFKFLENAECHKNNIKNWVNNGRENGRKIFKK